MPIRVIAGVLLWSFAVPGARGMPGRRPVARGEARLASSGDAYLWEARARDGRRWRLGTAHVEKQIQLKQGHLVLTSFRDRVTGHEYVGGASDVLRFTWNGQVVTGRSAEWVLDRVVTRRLKQGELLLQLALHAPGVSVVKSYLLYPRESIIQEWMEVTNRSRRGAVLADPAALTMDIMGREAPDVDFTYMTGDNSDRTKWKFSAAPVAGMTKTFEGMANREYAPIQIYQNRRTRYGVFVGWDYIGRWRSTVGHAGGRPVHVTFCVVPYERYLDPGESVETPKAFTGVFHGDLDDMGHQLLDYQYRYKWDYTRAPYFPGTEMEGNWIPGSWWGGPLDPISTYRKVLHLVDMLRGVGADISWRDNGWWDREGNWNGPNWAETRRYLAQYGMQQIIYLPIQDADSLSAVARAHPGWVVGQGGPVAQLLDQSNPAVLDWELKMLESRRRQWGDFQWRKDWFVTSSDTNRMLAQDQGFRHLVRRFLDRNPGMAFHGCAGGAQDLGYEFLRMAVSWSAEDGFSDHYRMYYPSYIFPPDKLENLPDVYLPENYTKESWRGLLTNRFPMMGETADPAKLEGIRQLFDLYHYLTNMGVVGRWGWVYHPVVTGDSADWYLERLNRDHRRGVIIMGHAQKTPVTIYPKGLLPDVVYHVSYQESGESADRSGAELMTRGISFVSVPDGELIYLNLPLHPGSTADHTPPTPPSRVTQQVATHMDYTGVEVRWRPGHDDNWVSYYQIYRNGVPLAKVAKGTYYFDHALGADLAAHYAVTTVDGSGNVSAAVTAVVGTGPAAEVVDDTSAALTYTGAGWTHQTKQWSVANGTQSVTNTKGDAVSYPFTGNRITWYGRMGPDKGVAAVYLDGQLDRLVDTYAAEDTPNIAVYTRTFPSIEPHTLKIVALGVQTGMNMVIRMDAGKGWGPQLEANMHAPVSALLTNSVDTSHHVIVVDGVQVDRTPPHVVKQLPQWKGARLSYTFIGTGITWVGRRCTACGTADVYVDGRLETSVDTYATPVRADASFEGDEQRNVPLFMRRWSARGRHTLRIVVRPDANLWATGRAVYLDALHVDP